MLKNKCKILISQKLREEKKVWEFRLSIMSNGREEIFCKEENEDEFLESLRKNLQEYQPEDYDRIQRISRYSLTEERYCKDEANMRKIPDDLFRKVSKLLSEAHARTLKPVAI